LAVSEPQCFGYVGRDNPFWSQIPGYGSPTVEGFSMARFMNKNVAGVFVPQELIDEIDGAPKGRKLEKGVEIAGRMIKRIWDDKMCDGVHIMAIGREELVPDIMSAAGLI
jgi:5,10-methylenetetrahydrofolate reductase